MVKTGLIWSGMLFVFTALLSVYAWMQLPAGNTIPIHWDIHGEVDRWGNKMIALLLMPGIMVLIIGWIAIQPVITPRKDNVQRSEPALLAGWIGACVVLAGLHLAIVYRSLTGEQTMAKVAPLLFSLTLIVMGNYLAKSHANWIGGIRTRWTMVSEHAWTVANRTGGWCFVAAGLAGLVTAVFGDSRTTAFVVCGGAIASILISFAVSYFAWRDDPERAG